jgi:hypothetical protein
MPWDLVGARVGSAGCAASGDKAQLPRTSRVENPLPRIEAGSRSAEAGGRKRTDYRPRRSWDHPAPPAGPQGTACRCTRPYPAASSSDACFCPSHASADAERLMSNHRPTIAFNGGDNKTQHWWRPA